MAFRFKDLIIDLWGGAKGAGLCGPATKPVDGSEPRLPQTRAEIEELEEKLRAALVELAEHKKNLKP